MNFNTITFLHLVEIILAIQVLVSSFELLNVHYIFEDNGLLSWRIQRLNHSKVATLSKKLGLNFLFQYPNIIGLIVVKIVAAFCLPILILTNHSVIIPLVLITVINLLLVIRSPQSNDGSDQMAMIILISVTLAEIINSDFSKETVLFFIAAQSCLAYGVSGFLKQRKKGWHDGSYVKEILKTSSFGNKSILEFVNKYKVIGIVLGYIVVYGDCILSFSFAFPPSICLSLLSFGVLLHIGIARIMGLNTFLWSFGATYPAIYFVSLTLYNL